MKRAVAMPDDAALERVARDVAARLWTIQPLHEVHAALEALPEGVRGHLNPTAALQGRHRYKLRGGVLPPPIRPADSSGERPEDATEKASLNADASIPGMRSPGELVALPASGGERSGGAAWSAVRVEVWKQPYDRDSQRIVPERLNAVTVSRERGGA